MTTCEQQACPDCQRSLDKNWFRDATTVRRRHMNVARAPTYTARCRDCQVAATTFQCVIPKAAADAALDTDDVTLGSVDTLEDDEEDEDNQVALEDDDVTLGSVDTWSTLGYTDHQENPFPCHKDVSSASRSDMENRKHHVCKEDLVVSDLEDEDDDEEDEEDKEDEEDEQEEADETQDKVSPKRKHASTESVEPREKRPYIVIDLSNDESQEELRTTFEQFIKEFEQFIEQFIQQFIN